VKSRKIGRACSTYGTDDKCLKNVGRKHEGKRPPRRRRGRWEDNIKMNLREIWWEGVDWIHLAQDRDQRLVLVETVIKRRIL
jgi:hypothetical protein